MAVHGFFLTWVVDKQPSGKDKLEQVSATEQLRGLDH